MSPYCKYVSKSEAGAGHSLFAFSTTESWQLCARSDREPLQGPRWENRLSPSLIPSTEAVLQTPATLVSPVCLLWGWKPSYYHSPPPIIVSASFPEERKRKKGNSECQQLRPENPNRISQDKIKALLQIWNFIPDQFQRAAPDIQASELLNNNQI